MDWFFVGSVFCFVFRKERVAREGEAILGLVDFNYWKKTLSLPKCPFFCSNCFYLHTKSGTAWVDLEVPSVTQSASVSATQGDYDPSRTKVLHFSMNPASLAKQQRKEEQQQLQEECERLRELVRVLEGGGSIPGNLEGVASFQSPQEVAGRLLASGREGALSHPCCQRNRRQKQMGTLQSVLDGRVIRKMKKNWVDARE